MTRCLKYDLRRVFMSRSIWAYAVFPALLPVLLCFFVYDTDDYVSELIRQYITYGSLLCAVFTSFFTRRSVSDRTFKNRIMTGSRKSAVYISEVITSVLITFSGFLIYSATVFILFKTDSSRAIIMSVLAVTLWLLFFCCLYVFLCSFFTSNIFVIFLSTVFIFAMMSVGSSLDVMLSEPQYETLLLKDSGEEIKKDNPYYISGLERDVLVFLYESGPYALQTENLQISRVTETAELTIPLIFLSFIGGTLNFCRKELD